MAKKTTVQEETSDVVVSPLVMMTGRDLLRAIVCGVGIGLLVAGAMLLLHRLVFDALLCRPDNIANCSEAPLYSAIVAYIIGLFAGVVGLAKLGIYRPLLIVLASTISLWGIHTFLPNVAWYGVLIAGMLLFGLAYGLFTWIARIRSFVVALVVTIVLVVVLRLVMTA